MEKEFHIYAVNIKNDTRLGKLIVIDATPYVETNMGYCINANGGADYNIPCNDKTLSFIREVEEFGDIWLDKEDC